MSDPVPEHPVVESLGKAQKLEFRLKVLQQFTTLSVAGAGFALTLLGTVLDRTAIISWIPVGMFLCAAFLAMIGQMQVSALAERDTPSLPRNAVWTGVIAYFLGGGIGGLCLAVLKAGNLSG